MFRLLSGGAFPGAIEFIASRAAACIEHGRTCTLRAVDWSANCAAVVPCLNEADTIAGIVRELRQFVATVIVVDDGSTDATSDLASRAGARVIRNEQTLGKGAALRAGWDAARALGAAWAIMLDGDGQHAVPDLPRFFDCAARTNAALVIGNRMADATRMPWVRRTVNRWMSARLSSLAGRALPDTQCGYRLVRLDALARVPLSTTHYEIESEQVLAFVKASLPVEFVPVTVIYRQETSKIRPWRDTVRWFRWLSRWKQELSGPRE